MSIILTCAVLGLGIPGATPCDRGGHALAVHDRGGHATPPLEPIGNLTAWTCIHRREGAWNAIGGTYWGGLQMDVSFMTTYGSDMIRKYGGWANRWSPRDQMVVAQRAWRTRGYYPWPQTARACGYL